MSRELVVNASPVIVLCKAGAVVDDRAARRCAEALGVPVLGALGILLSAKRLGIIPAIIPVLDSVIDAGFRISEDMKTSVLRLAGEQS